MARWLGGSLVLDDVFETQAAAAAAASFRSPPQPQQLFTQTRPPSGAGKGLHTLGLLGFRGLSGAADVDMSSSRLEVSIAAGLLSETPLRVRFGSGFRVLRPS